MGNTSLLCYDSQLGFKVTWTHQLTIGFVSFQDTAIITETAIDPLYTVNATDTRYNL